MKLLFTMHIQKFKKYDNRSIDEIKKTTKYEGSKN